MDNAQKAVFPGRFDSLAAIGEFVTRAAEDAGLDARAAYQVQMAVDEACSNIITHAYSGEGHGVIECSYHIDDTSLTVTLRDYGQPFDPTRKPPPDLHTSLQERNEGGLGLYFIHTLMDEVRFEFTSGSGNVLTLVKFREVQS